MVYTCISLQSYTLQYIINTYAHTYIYIIKVDGERLDMVSTRGQRGYRSQGPK